jgi:hypothetical protein
MVLAGFPELDKLAHECNNIRPAPDLFFGRLVIAHFTQKKKTQNALPGPKDLG